ncbi:NAD(P)H-binding protein [Luteococcus sp. Sow4_B9]|uniref:NAD(P)H-binding protein n=1 Tax=Luteococcus sp. Sow4_B9 TaxID=3438792 RepID=UPI003F98ED3C
MTETAPHTIVLGAGPVGLAASLLLATQGHRVTIHEAHDELDLSAANSYPIGVNTRGQEALRRIDPALLQQLRDEAEVVEAFIIRNGTRRIARLDSGRLLATTRAFLTQILLDRATRHPAITIHTGHRLIGLDLASRTLTFATADGEVTVEAAEARVLAADGVRSRARSALAEQVPGFSPLVGDWGVQFRVAFSKPGASAPGLDPAIHHIFTSRGIYTATLSDGVWGVVVTAIEGDDAEELLLSTTASGANIQALRAHIEQHAPLAAPLLTHDDLAAYFDRKPFSGAVVRCDQLAFDEWLLLVGDAAHSVLPPTGEGVNSGLEDAFLLAEHAASGSETWFADFEAQRLPDLAALGEYAWTLRDNLASTDPARRGATVALRIVDAVATALPGVPSARVESRLFGPDSGLEPYREAIGPWLRQRRALYPVAYRVAQGVHLVAGKMKSDSDSDVQHHSSVTASHPDPLAITVVGGSQGSGRALAELALRHGHRVTVVSRSGTSLEGARIVTGDATDPQVARDAVAGADAVVVAVGGSKDAPRARTEVTRAVITAMQQEGVDRLVVQTSLGAGASAEQLPVPMRQIAPRMLAQPLADHDEQEDAVRGSGLRWTIVRPAGLTDGDATGRWRSLDEGGNGTLGGRISRSDVAHCLLDVVGDEATVGQQLGISG